MLIGILFLVSLSPVSYAMDATFIGPTSGPINEYSEPFTISTDKDFNGRFRVEVKGGGLDQVLKIDFAKGDVSHSFQIKPTALGPVTLLANPDGGPKIDKQLTYNVVQVDPTPTPTPSATSTPTPTSTSTTTPSATPTTTNTSTSTPSATSTPTSSASPSATTTPSTSSSPSPSSNPTSATSPTPSANSGSVVVATTSSPQITSGLISSSSTTGSGSTSSSTTNPSGEGLQLFFPVAPTSKRYDPSEDFDFSFQVMGVNSNVLVTILLPQGATDVPADVFVTCLSTPEEVSAGLISLRIDIRRADNGQTITSLKAPMEIRYWHLYQGQSFQLIEDSGAVTIINRASSAASVQATDPTYFVQGDGTYSVFLRQLSEVKAVANASNPGISSRQRLRAFINSPRERNRIYLLQSGANQKLLIDLATQYGKQKAQLEIRRYLPGTLTYTSLITLQLDTQGDATYVVKKPLLIGDRLRVQINGTKIVYVTI
jgi:hypothetical protein